MNQLLFAFKCWLSAPPERPDAMLFLRTPETASAVSHRCNRTLASSTANHLITLGSFERIRQGVGNTVTHNFHASLCGHLYARSSGSRILERRSASSS
jgi:hypothetical protein